MKKYNSQFKEKEEKLYNTLKESKIGSSVYKMLGQIIKEMEKADMSIIDKSEKDNIKERLNQIKNMCK